MFLWKKLSNIFKCFDCPTKVDPSEDPFCLVTPHGARGVPAPKIPLCRDCRVKEGYDILDGEFCVVDDGQRQITFIKDSVDAPNEQRHLTGAFAQDAEATVFKGD